MTKSWIDGRKHVTKRIPPGCLELCTAKSETKYHNTLFEDRDKLEDYDDFDENGAISYAIKNENISYKTWLVLSDCELNTDDDDDDDDDNDDYDDDGIDDDNSNNDDAVWNPKNGF